MKSRESQMLNLANSTVGKGGGGAKSTIGIRSWNSVAINEIIPRLKKILERQLTSLLNSTPHVTPMFKANTVRVLTYSMEQSLS